MTWNFDYTIPSLIVLIFFLVFYFIKPILLSQSNRLFCSFVIVEVFGFFITFFSCYADAHSSVYKRSLLIILNNIYYIVFILRYFLISLFFAYLLNVRVRKDIPTIITSIVVSFITVLVLINPWTDFIYVFNSDGKFQRGEYFLLIYYANIFTLILDVYYLIRFGRKLDVKGLITSIFSILSLLACSLMDIYYVDYLITDMFFLFVMLIFFFSFENPDTYLDKKTELFNFQAFSYVIQEYLFRKKKYSIVTFIIKNYPEKKQIYGVKQMDLALKEIGRFFLSKFHNKKCFYLLNGKFAIIDNSTKDFARINKAIEERFKQPWNINNLELHLNIFIVDVDSEVNFTALEDIYAGFGIAYEEAENTSASHITINQKSFEEIVRKTKVTRALNRALLENDLQVYMQPIVDSATRKIIAAEALVRIYDKDMGIIPPIEFIKIAEKNGSIEQLGEQVLNKVCIFLKESNIYDYGIQWINVNLSPVQCQNNKLQEKIDNITNLNTIDHKYIHLEITEDSMIDAQILKKQMNVLVTDGYKFSLDDFGSGFSNIIRVKNFPFNNIKLDMSIIKEHFISPDNMLPSIVKTFTERGLSVTAEGVETKEMADSLQKMGCEFLQGYYFSKPIPVKDFQEIVFDQNIKNLN